MEKSFGTVLNCIDGRAQIPAINWMKENFSVDYVDSITAPGIDKILSQGELNEISDLKNKVKVSITAHNSNVIAIVGHHDCAANPVDKYEHIEQIAESIYTIKAWEFPVTVIGLWIDEYWHVHVINI